MGGATPARGPHRAKRGEGAGGDRLAGVSTPTRTAFVPAARLSGWVDRFAASHGGLAHSTDTDDGVKLDMRDGAEAVLAAPWPDDGRPGRGPDLLSRLIAVASQERSFGILLVRRGGFAVGVAAAGKLLAHKVGGSSSRSRGGDQAGAVVERAGQEAARIFAGHGFEYMATGGDKQLVESVLALPALRKQAVLPRLAPLAVTDPNMAVLTKAAADFAAVRIKITDPA